jgi:hypothetical protein
MASSLHQHPVVGLFPDMSTHEITAADCTWAEVHFSDIGEARDHLDGLIATRQSMQSLRAARLTVSEGCPMGPELQSDLARIDRAIEECKREECELQQLIADCAMDDLFDLV